MKHKIGGLFLTCTLRKKELKNFRRMSEGVGLHQPMDHHIPTR